MKRKGILAIIFSYEILSFVSPYPALIFRKNNYICLFIMLPVFLKYINFFLVDILKFIASISSCCCFRFPMASDFPSKVKIFPFFPVIVKLPENRVSGEMSITNRFNIGENISTKNRLSKKVLDM